MQLDVDLGFEGMKEEIGNLEKCGAGKVIGQAEVDALTKKHPLMRVIPSRWVSAYKNESRVRVRIVANDLNRGISAQKLGISSPTPSIEGLRFVLTLADKICEHDRTTSPYPRNPRNHTRMHVQHATAATMSKARVKIHTCASTKGFKCTPHYNPNCSLHHAPKGHKTAPLGVKNHPMYS